MPQGPVTDAAQRVALSEVVSTAGVIDDVAADIRQWIAFAQGSHATVAVCRYYGRLCRLETAVHAAKAAVESLRFTRAAEENETTDEPR